MGIEAPKYLRCKDGKVLLITQTPRQYCRVQHHDPNSGQVVIKEYGDKPEACDND